MKHLAHEYEGASPQLYNALDCCLTYEINDTLQDLPSPGPIYDFERALQAPVMEMMLRGFRVDPEARHQATRKLRDDLVAVENLLEKWTGAVWDRPYLKTFPNSTKQLIEFFYNRMGISPIKVRVRGEEKIPMDRKVLEKLEIHFQARPIVNAILAHRDITGQLEVLETEVDHDWRMRTTFNIAGTSTGRFSSSKSTTGSGQNFQNITEDLRYIFIPDPGHKLAGIDKSQAEAREVGFLCGILFGDWSYLDMIESGDPHTFTARLVWKDLPWTGDIKADRKIAEQNFYRHFTYRDMAKRGSHATNYYGKAYTIAQALKVPQYLVQNFQDAYFTAFPCIDLMHRWVARQLQTNQYLTNVFGRRRDFFDRSDSEETLRGAIAYMFQSATADDLNLGMWRIWKYMGDRIQLLLQLHDAVYFQFSLDDNEEDLIKTAQQHLSVELIAGQRSFIVPTDALTGFNMGHRWKRDDAGNKIDANPKGLDEPSWLH